MSDPKPSNENQSQRNNSNLVHETISNTQQRIFTITIEDPENGIFVKKLDIPYLNIILGDDATPPELIIDAAAAERISVSLRQYSYTNSKIKIDMEHTISTINMLKTRLRVNKNKFRRLASISKIRKSPNRSKMVGRSYVVLRDNRPGSQQNGHKPKLLLYIPDGEEFVEDIDIYDPVPDQLTPSEHLATEAELMLTLTPMQNIGEVAMVPKPSTQEVAGEPSVSQESPGVSQLPNLPGPPPQPSESLTSEQPMQNMNAIVMELRPSTLGVAGEPSVSQESPGVLQLPNLPGPPPQPSESLTSEQPMQNMNEIAMESRPSTLEVVGELSVSQESPGVTQLPNLPGPPPQPSESLTSEQPMQNMNEIAMESRPSTLEVAGEPSVSQESPSVSQLSNLPGPPPQPSESLTSEQPPGNVNLPHPQASPRLIACLPGEDSQPQLPQCLPQSLEFSEVLDRPRFTRPKSPPLFDSPPWTVSPPSQGSPPSQEPPRLPDSPRPGQPSNTTDSALLPLNSPRHVNATLLPDKLRSSTTKPSLSHLAQPPLLPETPRYPESSSLFTNPSLLPETPRSPESSLLFADPLMFPETPRSPESSSLLYDPTMSSETPRSPEPSSLFAESPLFPETSLSPELSSLFAESPRLSQTPRSLESSSLFTEPPKLSETPRSRKSTSLFIEPPRLPKTPRSIKSSVLFTNPSLFSETPRSPVLSSLFTEPSRISETSRSPESSSLSTDPSRISETSRSPESSSLSTDPSQISETSRSPESSSLSTDPSQISETSRSLESSSHFTEPPLLPENTRSLEPSSLFAEPPLPPETPRSTESPPRRSFPVSVFTKYRAAEQRALARAQQQQQRPTANEAATTPYDRWCHSADYVRVYAMRLWDGDLQPKKRGRQRFPPPPPPPSSPPSTTSTSTSTSTSALTTLPRPNCGATAANAPDDDGSMRVVPEVAGATTQTRTEDHDCMGRSKAGRRTRKRRFLDSCCRNRY